MNKVRTENKKIEAASSPDNQIRKHDQLMDSNPSIHPSTSLENVKKRNTKMTTIWQIVNNHA
jgi:hypothetical protein